MIICPVCKAGTLCAFHINASLESASVEQEQEGASAVKIEFQDYYERLGVARDAKPKVVQSAYRKLARKYHPDVNKEASAEERFKSITEAYEVLKDPDKRRRYDELGENWDRISPEDFERQAGDRGRRARERDPRFSQAFEGGGSGFSDFFEAFFGAGSQFTGASFGSEAPEWSMPGEDHEAQIEVTLDEAHRGAQKSIELGSTGPDGRPLSHQRYNVTIPQGVREGTRIRLAGQGGPGMGNGTAGDLWLVVHLSPDPRFQVRGHDLETRLRLAPWEAALGAIVKVPTLSGQADLKVPAGVSSGQKLRLRGQGLARRSKPAGDLIVVLEVWVPKELSAREREHYEALRDDASSLPPDRVS